MGGWPAIPIALLLLIALDARSNPISFLGPQRDRWRLTGFAGLPQNFYNLFYHIYLDNGYPGKIHGAGLLSPECPMRKL